MSSHAPAGPALPPTGLSVWAVAAFVATVSLLQNLGERVAGQASLLGQEEAPLVLLGETAWHWGIGFVVTAAMASSLTAGLKRLPSGVYRRAFAMGLLVLCSATLAVLLQALFDVARHGAAAQLPHYFHFAFFWSFSLAGLLCAALWNSQRLRDAAQALQAAQLRQIDGQAELAAAQRQLLQAQNEPHFLFNALANVRRLLHTDAEGARALLDDLLRYLQAALPALRAEHHTLGAEAELVRAFLAVHQVRMGTRLQTEVDVPAALAAIPVPAMALLTLAENALKHGLQPLVQGGRIDLRARLVSEGRELLLTVIDTGQGFGDKSTGTGTGLANLRLRLKQLYGPQAQLSLAVNEPLGVVAEVRLPMPLGRPS